MLPDISNLQEKKKQKEELKPVGDPHLLSWYTLDDTHPAP
jgi:hypothetical protein